MAEYRLYHFNGDHIRSVDTVRADDEFGAIDQAEQLAGGKLAELWRGGRKVKTFNPDREPRDGPCAFAAPRLARFPHANEDDPLL